MLERQHRVFPATAWWIGMLLIVLCAGALRYTGMTFSLPYIDHVDEASYNIAARMVIDSGSAMPIGMHGYPPGIVAVNQIFIRLFHDAATPPGTILPLVRFVSVTFSVGCVIAIGLLAFRVVSPLAGWIAAGAWTIAPVIVEHSRYGTADNFVTFFALMALFLTLSGTRFDRNELINGGLLAVILAILFKYQAIFILPLVLAIPLYRLLDHTIPRARVIRTTGTHLVILALFAVWLVLLFPALEATRSPDWTAATERLGFPTLDELIANGRVTLNALAPDWVWWVDWIGIALFLLRPLRKQIDALALAAVALAALAWLVGISFYGSLGTQQFRQFIALGAFLEVLRAVGLAGWALAIVLVVARGMTPARRTWVALASAAFVGLGTLLLTFSDVTGSIANAQEHTLPDRRNDLAAYFDGTLEGGRVIATTENHKTFNRSWGGYAGRDVFPLEAITSVEMQPLDEWRAAGVRYAIVPYYTLELMQTAARTGEAIENRVTTNLVTTITPDLLDSLLLLKTYPPSPDHRGPNMAVFSLQPMSQTFDGTIGTIGVVGYDLDGLDNGAIAPGASLDLRLYWRADAPTAGDYAVFNHLVGADGTLIAQADGDPLPGGRGTSAWHDPDETLISRDFALTIPDDAPPGDYTLQSGFYRRDDGERLTTADGADHLVIADVRID